jgi:alkaline phosphatase
MGYQTDRPRAADIEEQIGLLNTQNARKRTRRKIVYTTLGALALLTIAVVAFTVPTPRTHKRNLIIMISDGFGPASETYGRSFFQFINNLPENYTTPLDDILVGASRTRSSDSLVTDSAAGATAFSCALKTYNGAIGVDPSGKPCGTVLEAAKARHMHTGLVVTSRITHATPGAFSAHVLNRNEEEAIAVQQIGDNPLGRTVDLMFGGGACFFLPNTTVGSCRSDERDLFTEAGKYGWSIMKSRAEFDQLSADKTQLPLMGLFASDHMDYEIDRDPNRQPALHEMAEKALAILDQHSDNGFFLMIEGSRIDMAAHTNDPAAHVHDILEYHRTVQIVLDYVNSHPDTVMISVSDHETGGFTLGLQINETYPDYIWYPQVIQAVTNSTESLARTLCQRTWYFRSN